MTGNSLTWKILSTFQEMGEKIKFRRCDWTCNIAELYFHLADLQLPPRCRSEPVRLLLKPPAAAGCWQRKIKIKVINKRSYKQNPSIPCKCLLLSLRCERQTPVQMSISVFQRPVWTGGSQPPSFQSTGGRAGSIPAMLARGERGENIAAASRAFIPIRVFMAGLQNGLHWAWKSVVN